MNTKRDEILNRMKQDIIRSCDKRAVYIVEGAPGAGKTTYVQKQKQPGDMVVDLDLISAALQGDTISHPDYEPVMDAVLAVRDAIYNIIEKRQGKWKAAYIITSNPNEDVVKKLATRLQGEIVSLDTCESVCIERIKQDITRADKQRDIELVNKWYTSRQ